MNKKWDSFHLLIDEYRKIYLKLMKIKRKWSFISNNVTRWLWDDPTKAKKSMTN